MHVTADSRWLAGPRPLGPTGTNHPADPDDPGDPAELRLFTFSHAGGGSTFFRPWRAALGAGVDVRSVVLPGRESRARELPYRRLEQFLDPLCEALGPHLDRPYAFFGHSLGSIVAFEVARRLEAGPHGGPRALIVSGRRAPGLPTARRPFSALSDEEFLAAVAGLGGTPPEVLGEAQLLRLFLPTLRADFEVNESYRPLPGPGLTCPVVAYMGARDPEVNHAELLAWHRWTSGEFTLRVLPGDHFYLKDDEVGLPEVLLTDLGRAIGRPS